jgi:hypothetical protein
LTFQANEKIKRAQRIWTSQTNNYQHLMRPYKPLI